MIALFMKRINPYEGESVLYLYSFLFYLALPLIIIRLYWRSRNLPAYRKRLGERFGYYSYKLDQCIWIHAVSVGESLAAIPLIKILQTHYPMMHFLVTTMTPTGADRIKASLGESVTHVYLPYDLPSAVARFLNAMNPCIAMIMETELWPNLFAACYQRQIPICLLNARLSDRSAKKYGYIAAFTRHMLERLTIIAAHGKTDAERFIALGAKDDQVKLTGNLKFDLQLPHDLQQKARDLRELLGINRFVWIAASTHEGEEEQILAVHQQIVTKNPTALLILVPRHPNRFDEVARLCERMGFEITRRSSKSSTTRSSIYLGDTMGELLFLYAVADVAFVGGSLVAQGGHNMLEPGALGKAILTGKHLFNFKEISDMFIAAQALIVVSDVKSFTQQLFYLMEHPSECRKMGERALGVIAANQGALQKQFDIIRGVIERINVF